MARFLNDLHGIVWSINRDHMIILLPRGGRISAPKKEGISVGDHVAFTMNATDKQVLDVILKEEADETVKRGSDHIFNSASREPPTLEEEEFDEIDDICREDRSLLWHPDFE